MRPLETRAGREAVKGSVTVWRPWQLKPLELCQAIAVSDPSRRQWRQEYLLTSVQSGTADFQYRNTRISGSLINGTLFVVEPEEPWTRQFNAVTFYCLHIDPAWLQQASTELLQDRKSVV